MSDIASGRRSGSNQTVGVHARQMPVAAHEGDFRDVLCRHERAAREAARGTRQQRHEFAGCLLDRVADPRNLMCAIDSIVIGGDKAPGPNGLRLEELSRQEQWALARSESDAITSGTYRPGPVRRKQIRKTSGTGFRTLEIPNVEDKVAQKAIVLALQPLIDPIFDNRSFGFRPGLGREQALVEASMLIDGNSVIIIEDLRDAFTQIPHGRLLDVLRRHGFHDDLLELIERIIGNDRKRGLGQGGPLSPLLMNCYADFFIDRPWRRKRPDTPLIRVADDLLIIAESYADAQAAYDDLEQMTTPAGLPLKYGSEKAICRLDQGKTADWLGYQIAVADGGIEARIGPQSWNSLDQKLELAHEEPFAPIRATETILGWINQRGPSYQHEDIHEVLTRVISLAKEHACEELPSLKELRGVWERADIRFQQLYRVKLLEQEGRIASGSARRHRDSAKTGRGGEASQLHALLPSIYAARPHVRLFTDGSCFGPRGVGDWAFTLVGPGDGERRCQADSHPRTTANRMELTAVVRGLEAVDAPSVVTVVSDSQYVVENATKRLAQWKENGWTGGSAGRRKRLKNIGLWRRLDALLQRHEVTFEWVRGHSGHRENEEVDRRARRAAGQLHLETAGTARNCTPAITAF